MSHNFEQVIFGLQRVHKQLWFSTKAELSDQPDFYRLSHAPDTAREYHWIYQVLIDE